MRLTTKFSAFVTLLTSLTIFVTLIGASLSFYNGIQLKMENRVQAVATMLDNRLISSSFDKLEPQMDELMTPVEIVQVDFLLNGKPVYGHSRSDSYRPPGSKNQYREITVPSLKHPGMTIHVVYLDPMFPHKQKSALVKKEMRVFQSLVGPDLDADGLLEPARQLATKRVVVKRPDYAPPLADVATPNAVVTKGHRFDIYAGTPE